MSAVKVQAATAQEPRPRFRFTLRTVFGATTFICCILAVGTIAPGIALWLAIILTPSLARTWAALTWYRDPFTPIRLGKILGIFVTSIGVTMVAEFFFGATVLALSIPLGGVASALGGELWYTTSEVISGLGGIGVGAIVFWNLWGPIQMSAGRKSTW